MNQHLLSHIGYLSDDDNNNIVSYSFSASQKYNGMFDYKIEDAHLDEEGVREILGSVFFYNSEGICTFAELPKFIQKEFDERMTTEQRFHFGLVSKESSCDGHLVITQNL